MSSSILPGVTPSVTAATTPVTSTTSSSTSSTGVDSATIAGNFTQFLQLLTTQLQNQDPTSPLDTNQFTQQLVEFAQVEQQLKSNDQLSTLVSLQQTAQQTQALSFVGATVAVDGNSAQLKNSQATWNYSPTKPAAATITITNSTGQTVFSNSFTAQAGQQKFTWDGHGNDGTQWPDGTYKLAINAVDASGQPVDISTEVDGTIDSVDLTQTPPLLSVDGQTFTLNQIKRVMAPASASSSVASQVSQIASALGLN
jgi:flagellar basal-body rod modification protein FlgD